ncbi:hypothetical protein MMC25_001704 [Agyrium rufum]|nr:hypothetical protein [Agyrium rufum]
MYGPDVFAVLAPWRNKYWTNTNQAFGHPHNATWLDRNPVNSREPTPALSSTPYSEDESVIRLLLKFDKLSSSNEVQFGTDKKISHVLLKFPGVKAVSARQFVIVVRPDFTVSLKDRYSRYGTCVTQDGRVDDQMAPTEHILAGRPGLSKRWNEVVIFTGNLAYTIDFPNHAAGSSEYLKKVEAFQGLEDPTPMALLDAFDFQGNPTTVAPSRPFSPLGNKRLKYKDVRKHASSSSSTIRLAKDSMNGQLCVRETILTYPRPPQPQRKRKRESKMDDDEEKEKNAHEEWFKNFRS